jgi:hypothetical protein
MSTVYKDLKSRFDAEISYEGSEVHALALTVIREQTLRLLEGVFDCLMYLRSVPFPLESGPGESRISYAFSIWLCHGPV